MKDLLEVLRPRSDEIITFTVLGALLVLLLNASLIITLFYTSTGVDENVRQQVDSTFISALRQISEPLNGRLGNSVIWMFMGLLAFGLASSLLSLITSIDIYTKNRSYTPTEFLAKLMVRLSAVFAAIFWVYIFVVSVIPFGSFYFWQALGLEYGIFVSILQTLFVIAIFAFSLYLLAIFARFVTLKKRVFSN